MKASCLYACLLVSNLSIFFVAKICFLYYFLSVLLPCSTSHDDFQLSTVSNSNYLYYFHNSSYLDLLCLFNLIFLLSLIITFACSSGQFQPHITTKWFIQSFTHRFNVLSLRKYLFSLYLSCHIPNRIENQSLNPYYNNIIY